MKVLRILLVVSILVSTARELSAQYRHGYFRVGASLGATNYLGDLDDDFTFKFTKPGLGLHGSYRFNPFMTARLGFFQGWASATDERTDDIARNRRNLSFRTGITEVSAVLVFDFVPSDRGFYYRPNFTPYVFGGLALFSFNPEAQLDGEYIELQPLGTEGQFLPDPNDEYPDPYRLTQISVPLGIGIRLKLARNWDLEVETGFRKTFTDYLDDVSSEYPDLEELRAQNPTAAILSDRLDQTQFPGLTASEINGIRGDRTQTDWYIFTGATISYIIDWVKCPSFR